MYSSIVRACVCARVYVCIVCVVCVCVCVCVLVLIVNYGGIACMHPVQLQEEVLVSQDTCIWGSPTQPNSKLIN